MNKEFSKRAFCLILVLALSLTLFPVTASAAAPSDPLTRGIFFQLLAEVLHWNISDPDENPFRDLVEAAPYCNALLTAYEKGYVYGYSNGTIRPDAYMTKADAATIFYRIGGWKKKTNAAVPSDVPKSSWNYAAIQYVLERKLMKNSAKDAFCPYDSVTLQDVTLFCDALGYTSFKRIFGDYVNAGNTYEETINFNTADCNGSQNGKVKVTFDPLWFSSSPKIYNQKLAEFCVDYCMMGYTELENTLEGYLERTGFEVLSSNLHAGRDQVNYFIAAKTILVNGKAKNLVFVGTLGSHMKQWYSNFDPLGWEQETGTNELSSNGVDTHAGFADARDYVYGYLNKILTDKKNGFTADNTILLFTGHSRGAAAANLLAAKMVKTSWNTGSNIYAYTYATPNPTTDSAAGDTEYGCIFNIVNPEDFVTKVLLED